MNFGARLFRALLVLTILGVAGLFSLGAQEPVHQPTFVAETPSIPPLSAEILKVADVKTGMTGYGLTVFQGVEPQLFKVRVVGVLANFMAPKRHVILASCTDMPATDNNRDGVIDEYDNILKRGMISSGMSGSPVYLKCADGKYRLCGAVALGWPLCTDPVGGITPIEYMLEDMNTAPEKVSVRRRVGVVPRVDVSSDGALGKYREGLKYLSTPMCFSGFSRKALDRIAKDMEGSGFSVMQSGGAGGSLDSSKLKATAKPGSVIGVSLMKGDMEIYAYGTLTHVVGDKFVSFGHSFGDMGQCKLPVSLGYVNFIMNRLNSSFKMAGMLQDIGSTTQDRISALAGKLGGSAVDVNWIPVKIRVANKNTLAEGKSKYREFNMQVIDSELYTPSMVHSAYLNTIFNYVFTPQQYTAWVTTKIKFKDHDEIVMRDAYSGFGGNNSFLYFTSPGSIINSIVNNEFKKVTLEKVEMTVDYSSELKAASLVEVTPSVKRAAPGEEITLKLKLKTWRKDEWVEELKVRLPKDIKGDEIVLDVSGGTYREPLEDARFDSVEDMVALLNEITRESGIYVATRLPVTRLMYKGKCYNNLPPSIVEQLKASAPEKIGTGVRRLDLAKKDSKWIVDGYYRVVIKIDRQEKNK